MECLTLSKNPLGVQLRICMECNSSCPTNLLGKLGWRETSSSSWIKWKFAGPVPVGVKLEEFTLILGLFRALFDCF